MWLWRLYTRSNCNLVMLWNWSRFKLFKLQFEPREFKKSDVRPRLNNHTSHENCEKLFLLSLSHNLLSKRRDYVPCSKLYSLFSCECSHPWQGESITTFFAIASPIGLNNSSTSTPTTSITLFLLSIIIKIIIFYITLSCLLFLIFLGFLE